MRKLGDPAPDPISVYGDMGRPDDAAIQAFVRNMPREDLVSSLNTPCVPGRVQDEILRRLVLEDDLALWP